MAIKAFLGAYGVGSVVQYVSVLTRLGDGIRDLMFMVSDNELYCAHLKKMYDYLDIPNHMYQGSLTVENGKIMNITLSLVMFHSNIQGQRIMCCVM